MNTIGQRIRTLRKRERLSQRALAEICRCSCPTISDIENGHTGAPSSRVLAAMCEFFNVSERYILFGEDGDIIIPSKDQQHILELVGKLDDQQRQLLTSFLETLVIKNR